MPIYYRDLTASFQGKIPPGFSEGVESPDTFLAHLESLDTLMALEEFTRRPADKFPDDEISTDHIAHICDFFAMRWERIRQTKLAYTQYTDLFSHQLCMKLAKLIAPATGKSYFELLMPTLMVKNCAITGTALTDEALLLKHFVLSDDDDCIIEVRESLEFAKETGLLHHTSVLAAGNHPKLLSASERRRVIHHCHESYQFYTAIEKYVEASREDSSIGTRLRRLIDGLRAGGAHRGGQELNAGGNANVAILSFSEFLEELHEKYRAAHENLMQRARFRELWNRLARPAEADYTGTRYCVELTAGELETFLRDNQDLFQTKISRTMLNRTNCLKVRNKAEETYQQPMTRMAEVYSLQYDDDNQRLKRVLGAEHFSLARLNQSKFKLAKTLRRLPTKPHDDQLQFLNYLGNERLAVILKTPIARHVIYQELQTPKAKLTLLGLFRNIEELVQFLNRLSPDEAKKVIVSMGDRFFDFFKTATDLATYLTVLASDQQLQWLKKFNRYKSCHALIKNSGDLAVLLKSLEKITLSDLPLLWDYKNLAYIHDGFELANILSVSPIGMRIPLFYGCDPTQLQQRIQDGNQLAMLTQQLPVESTFFTTRSRSSLIIALLDAKNIRKLITTGYHLAAFLKMFPIEEQREWLIKFFSQECVQTLLADAHQLGCFLSALNQTLWPRLKDLLGQEKLESLKARSHQLGQILSSFDSPENHWNEIIEFLAIEPQAYMASHSSQELLNTLPLHTRWDFLHQILIPLIGKRLKNRIHLYMDLLPEEERITWFQELIVTQQLLIVCADPDSLTQLFQKLPQQNRARCLHEAITKYTIEVISPHLFSSFNQLNDLLNLYPGSLNRLAILQQIPELHLATCIDNLEHLTIIAEKLEPQERTAWLSRLSPGHYQGIVPNYRVLANLYRELIRLSVIDGSNVARLEFLNRLDRAYILSLIPSLNELFETLDLFPPSRLLEYLGQEQMRSLIHNAEDLAQFLRKLQQVGCLDSPEKQRDILNFLTTICHLIETPQQLITLFEFVDPIELIRFIGNEKMMRLISSYEDLDLFLRAQYFERHHERQQQTLVALIGWPKIMEVTANANQLADLLNTFHPNRHPELLQALSQQGLLQRIHNNQELLHVLEEIPPNAQLHWLAQLGSQALRSLVENIHQLIALYNQLPSETKPLLLNLFCDGFSNNNLRHIIDYCLSRQAGKKYFSLGFFGVSKDEKLQAANALFMNFLHETPLPEVSLRALTQGELGRLFRNEASCLDGPLTEFRKWRMA